MPPQIATAAVITGGTFGDVTSPVAGMTNMAAHAAGTDQIKYLRYASQQRKATQSLRATTDHFIISESIK
jgi:hypothetical protein